MLDMYQNENFSDNLRKLWTTYHQHLFLLNQLKNNNDMLSNYYVMILKNKVHQNILDITNELKEQYHDSESIFGQMVPMIFVKSAMSNAMISDKDDIFGIISSMQLMDSVMESNSYRSERIMNKRFKRNLNNYLHDHSISIFRDMISHFIEGMFGDLFNSIKNIFKNKK